MRDDILRRRRLVIRHIIGGAGIGPRHRGAQDSDDILEVNAAEQLAGLLDALCRAGAQLIEGAAPWAIDAGEAKEMHGRAAPAHEIEPARLGGDAPVAALADRAERRALIDPA